MKQILTIFLISTLIVGSIKWLDLSYNDSEPIKSNSQQRELKRPYTASGIASYYDYTLESGWSSVGHRVCATRDFTRYSLVKVTNLENGKITTCKITDFGPDVNVFPERIIDLSSTAFADIQDTRVGLARVVVEQLSLYQIK